MQVWETDLSSQPLLAKDLTICLGYFDGIHLGHQSLIRFAKSLQEASPLALLTFDRSPKLGRPETNLTPLETKKKIFKRLGVDILIILQFNDYVKSLTPHAFLNFLSNIGTRRIVCGPDYTFGNQGKGSITLIQEDARFQLHVFSHLLQQGNKISTSQIIQLLDQGNVDQIPPLLGRYYMVEGVVGKGLGEGRKMGYPTANIVLHAPFYLPKNGVYITLITIEGKPYYSLASLGFHPTVANLTMPTLEVFVLDYDANLYEKHVEVSFLHYIRSEQKFANKELLIAQMNQDKEFALAMKSRFIQ